ncbi:MAG: ATP-dependent DNA helicase RecG [Rhodoluna sp.]|nr:ATP-dependent DNA helicase RecG [Rhodoluna sp.]
MLLPTTALDRVLGDKTAKSFAKNLGLITVADLLQHYPRRYSSRGELTPITNLPVGESVSIVAEVVDARERRTKGRVSHILEVRITDGSGFLSLTFFNQAWRQKNLLPGTRGLFAGKIGEYQGKLQLAHPDYELFLDEVSQFDAKAWADKPIPIYPASASVTTWMIQKALGIVLDTLGTIEDEVPEQLAKKHKLMSLNQAFEKIHRPETKTDWSSATKTLSYHEAFLLQANLIARKIANEKSPATIRSGGTNRFLAAFDSALPFSLTKGQQSVGEEISSDLAKSYPMNRLLQGEVGSGKTLVALRAMLAVADTEGQSALLAPTEVLASQHFRSISKSLGEDLAKEIGLTLLTGQLSTADRKKAMLQVVSGASKIVIGTHALFSEKVEFYDLGLVVIDEQHRFGVEQREKLRLKGKLSPHVLTMTATPIPRTLAVTVFGDMAVSSLTELPAGRKEIDSHVVRAGKKNLVSRVWERVAEEVAKGHQVFVVCPKIDESDKDNSGASVDKTTTELRKNPNLASLRIDALHGRMDQEQKSDIMAKFVNKEIDVLVATTVIEVGVDVPNATVMVILDADNFGISQLHQLRGRVGRGQAKGLCLLLTGAEDGSIALQRIDAVAAESDGFKLSEIDLELRREGDVLGASQSGGRSSLRLLQVIRDAALIQKVRVEVEQLFEADPGLETSPTLRLAIEEMNAVENLSKG